MRRLPLYERLRVRTPCDEDWESMEPREQGRYCARCDHVVHELASMTRAEAEVIGDRRARGERVCLNVYVRRTDGALLLADGHVEREPALRSPSRVAAVAMAAATALTACGKKEAHLDPPPPIVAVAASAETAPVEPAPCVPPVSHVETEPPRTMPPPTAASAAPVPAPTLAQKTQGSKKAAPKPHYGPLRGI